MASLRVEESRVSRFIHRNWWLFALAATTILFYWKTLLTNQFSVLTPLESVNQAYSWFTFEVRALRAGQFPLWDPFMHAGRSFVGEMQTGLFYPLHWLLALVPLNRHGLLSPKLFHEYQALTHFLGAVFFFLLARRLVRSEFAAFLASLCFSLTGFVGTANWPHMLGSGIWLPLQFLLFLRAVRATSLRAQLRDFALCGLCLGLSILAGGLHLAMMQVLLLAGGAVWWMVYDRLAFVPLRWERRPAVWMAAGVVLAFAIAGALSSLQLFSSREFASHSIRFMGPVAMESNEKIPYSYINDRLIPQSIGTLLFASTSSGNGEYWSLYIGVLPFFLAMVGVWRCWHQHLTRFLVVTAAVGFLIALGSFTPLHGVVYATVPYLWMAREASRFVYLTQFAFCILMLFGTEAVLRASRESVAWQRCRDAVKWTGLAAGALIAVGVLFPKVELSVWNVFSLSLIVSGCGLLLRMLATPPSRGLLLTVVAFVFLDIGAFSWEARSRIEAERDHSDHLQRLLTCEPAMQFLRQQPRPFRVEMFDAAGLNIGDAFGIESTNGGAVTFTDAFETLRANPALLNSVYILRPAGGPDPDEVWRDPSWMIVRRRDAYPRAWIVHQAVVSPPKAPLPDLDLRRVAILDAASPVPVGTPAGDDSNRLRLTHWRPERMDYATNAEAPGLLVLSELWYPGWEARLNGKHVPLLQVDRGLRAVAIPAGRAAIQIQYAPWWWWPGLAATACALALVLWLCLRARGTPPGNELLLEPSTEMPEVAASGMR